MKKIFIILLLSILISSCRGEVRIIEAKNCSDYFKYSIGEGQTVFATYTSSFDNEDFIEYFYSNDINTNDFYIEAFVLDTGEKLDNSIIEVTSDCFYYFSFTCLKPFDVIKIEKVIHSNGKVQWHQDFYVELQFNSEYKYLPPHPKSYQKEMDLGLTHFGNLKEFGRSFYVLFNKNNLGIKYEAEYIIENISINNSYIELGNISYSAMPANFNYRNDFIYLDYSKQFEPINIIDFEFGAVIKIDFDLSSEDIRSVGCDLLLDIVFNGDKACIPLNVYYSSKRFN